VFDDADGVVLFLDTCVHGIRFSVGKGVRDFLKAETITHTFFGYHSGGKGMGNGPFFCCSLVMISPLRNDLFGFLDDKLFSAAFKLWFCVMGRRVLFTRRISRRQELRLGQSTS
jgi:hypothetical protein